jgi:hypothetical protein
MVRGEPRTGVTDTTRPFAGYRHVAVLQSLSSDGVVQPRSDWFHMNCQSCGEHHIKEAV